MITLKVYKHELDDLKCTECGYGDLDYYITEDGVFIFGCLECENAFKVIVVKPGEKK